VIEARREAGGQPERQQLALLPLGAGWKRSAGVTGARVSSDRCCPSAL
jgi:hypothetical protein